MNNMMKNIMGMNNKKKNQMGMNDMMDNQMNINNIKNNQMEIGMNNMMNKLNPNNNQMGMDNQNKNEVKIPRKKYNPNKKRKIPPILEKNANIIIESITFKVEKGLKPTGGLYRTQNIKQILNNLFQQRKQEINKEGKLVYLKENEPMEILHFKFDTKETEIYNFEKKSLIQGLVIAYKNHFPITITPDMIWLLILQGYSRFMDKYSELVREKYVNFSGQKTLYINRYGIAVSSASEEVWDGIIDEVVEQIGDHIGEEIILNLQSDFSTTNSATLLASQA
jgi:hypothetical protein